jgi:surfeit locus 1 family protein
MKKLSLFWPLVFTLPGVVILLIMGGWQIERLAWKEALIAERTAGLTADPVVLPETADEAALMNFRRVVVSGRYLKGLDFQLQNRNHNGVRGVGLISAFRRTVTEGGATVLINRGWVPLAQLNNLPAVATDEDTVVRGVVRTGATGRNAFTPDNDPKKSIWYSVDPLAMATSVGLTAWPLVIEIDQDNVPGIFPATGLSHYELKNNHLSYALTWFSLAAGLVVIFGLFLRQRLRDRT